MIKIVADNDYAVVITRDEIEATLEKCRSEVQPWGWESWVETYPEEADDGTLNQFRIVMGPIVNTHPSFYFIRYYGGMSDETTDG